MRSQAVLALNGFRRERFNEQSTGAIARVANQRSQRQRRRDGMLRILPGKMRTNRPSVLDGPDQENVPGRK